MKTFINGVLAVALFCYTVLSTPTVSTDTIHLESRVVRPCPDICPEPRTVAQPTGPNGSCACPSTAAPDPRVVHPCPEIICPLDTENLPNGSNGECGCFPIRPLPTPRSIHCDVVCLPGTEHDPNGPICNCDKTVPTLPEKRNPQVVPVRCDVVCPPGYENDPVDGDCNCAKPICDPSHRCLAIGELYKYNPRTHSCQCELQVECLLPCPPGFENDPAISGCNCLKPIPSPSTSATAIPTLPPRNIEERNPKVTPVCHFACPPGFENDPAISDCNCLKPVPSPSTTATTVPTLPPRNIAAPNPEATPVCRFACPPCRAHDPAIPGCNCALDTCPAATTLTKMSTLAKRMCDIVCVPPEVFNADGCGCHLPAGEKREVAIEERECDIVCLPPLKTNVGSCGCHSEP